MKLMITGGHVTPALAVIDELQQTHSNISILFVGRRYVSDNEHNNSYEYSEILKRSIPFFHLRTGRFTRTFTLSSLINILKIPVGFFNAFSIVRKEKPDVILSFGGYLALPISLAGFILGKKIYTHEQTIHPGIANKVIGLFAEKVFISFKETGEFFNQAKVVHTGNPVRKQIYSKTTSIEVPQGKPVIFITGGSLGSHSINVHIQKIVEKLVEKYTIIHQTGNVEEFNDYESSLTVKEQLPEKLKQHYIVRQHISSEDIGGIYHKADLVISRAGANTFFELIALQKPALFIPLPWSAHNEQQKQAELFDKWGTGRIFFQEKNSQELYDLVEEVMGNKETYIQAFEKIPHIYKKDAVESIVTNILHKTS